MAKKQTESHSISPFKHAIRRQLALITHARAFDVSHHMACA